MLYAIRRPKVEIFKAVGMTQSTSSLAKECVQFRPFQYEIPWPQWPYFSFSVDKCLRKGKTFYVYPELLELQLHKPQGTVWHELTKKQFLVCKVTKETSVGPKFPQNTVQIRTDHHTEFSTTCCACTDICVGNPGQVFGWGCSASFFMLLAVPGLAEFLMHFV